jgi:hypothetical protein
VYIQPAMHRVFELQHVVISGRTFSKRLNLLFEHSKNEPRIARHDPTDVTGVDPMV